MDAVGKQAVEFLHRWNEFQHQELPNELGLECIATSQTTIASFVWASEDINQGRELLQRVKNIWPVGMDMVTETTPANWLKSTQRTIPPYGTQGAYAGVLVPKYGKEVQEALGRYISTIPGAARSTVIQDHRFKGKALSPTMSSCFPHRQPHVLIELLGIETNSEAVAETVNWVRSCYKDVRQVPGVDGKGGYVALAVDVPGADCYPQHWERLQALKAKVDPHNRFRHTNSGLTGHTQDM
jgi:FAD/FMN-containing dehydrogenase